MARTTESLDIEVTTSSAEANLRRLSAQFSQVATNLSTFTNKLDITTKMSTRFGYGIATAMTNVVASVGAVLSIEHFAKFDNSMRNINTLAKMSERGFANMRKEVLDLSAEFGKMPQDATAAMKHIVSSGVEMREGFIKQSDAMKLLRVSSALSVAGQSDLDGTTKLMVRTMIAYGKSMSEAEHVADVLFQTVNRGIVEFPELTAHLGELMGIASTAKIPLEELMGVFVAITKQLNPAEAVTAFRTMIMTLSHPPKAMENAFYNLEKRSVGAALKTQGLVYVLEKIRKMSHGGSLEDLFAGMGMNQKTVKGMATAFSENPEEFRKDVASVNDPAQVQMAHSNAYREQTKAFGQEMNRLKASMSAIGLTIMQQVEAPLARLMKSFSDMAPKIMDWCRENKILINDLMHIGTAFGALFAIEMGFIVMGSAIGTALRPLSLFLTGMTQLSAIAKIPFKGIMSNLSLAGKPALPPMLKDGVKDEWISLTTKQMYHQSGKEGAKPLSIKEMGRLSIIDALMKKNDEAGIPFRDWEMKMDKTKLQMSEGTKLAKAHLGKSGSGFVRMGESFKNFGKSFSSDFSGAIPGMSIADHMMNNSLTGTRIDSRGRRQYIPTGNRVRPGGNMMTGFAPRFLNFGSLYNSNKGGSGGGAMLRGLSSLGANMITPFKKVFDFIEKGLVSIFSPSKWFTMFKGLSGGLLAVMGGGFGSLWALLSGGATAAFTAIGGIAGILTAAFSGISIAIAAVVGIMVYALVPGESLGAKFKAACSWVKDMGISLVKGLKDGWDFAKGFFENFEFNINAIGDWITANANKLLPWLGSAIGSVITTTMKNILVLGEMLGATFMTTILWLSDNWMEKGWKPIVKDGMSLFLKFGNWQYALAKGLWESIKQGESKGAWSSNSLTDAANNMDEILATNYKGKNLGEALKKNLQTYVNQVELNPLADMEDIGLSKLILKVKPVVDMDKIDSDLEDAFGDFDKFKVGGTWKPKRQDTDPNTALSGYTRSKSVEDVRKGSVEAVKFEAKAYGQGGDDAVKVNTKQTVTHLQRLIQVSEANLATSKTFKGSINGVYVL